MRKFACLILLFLPLCAGLFCFLFYAFWAPDFSLDMVAVNEIYHSVKRDWEDLNLHRNETSYEYVVLDAQGGLLYRTKRGLNETAAAAVSHRDTVLVLEEEGVFLGKILIFNDSEGVFLKQKRALLFLSGTAMLAQTVVCAGIMIYFYRTRIRPFHVLKGFAERIADGNLEIPLQMDKGNVFGAFTESFDIMRAELKRAKIAEAKANREKKELTAKLSHDIKTPVASIKAASEVGLALAKEEKIKENYARILMKADQIHALAMNLFTATMEELKQLTVTPVDFDSRLVYDMLANADYLNRAVLPKIPECLLFADTLRLQQVFDNLFSNSYKYADTDILVLAKKEVDCLCICIEDTGGGVGKEELPLLTEKFMRGSNAAQMEGAGLGLYISDRFLTEMGGCLCLENGAKGLRAVVRIAFSGTA